MKDNKFLEAMSYIDNDIVEEAFSEYRKPKKRYATFLALAASLVLVIGLAIPIIVFNFADKIKNSETNDDTTFTVGSESSSYDGNVSSSTVDSDYQISESFPIVFEGTNGNISIMNIDTNYICFIIEKGETSEDFLSEDMNNIEGIKIPENSHVHLIIDGEETDKIPNEAGTYTIEASFENSSPSAKEMKLIFTYYFFMKGFISKK